MSEEVEQMPLADVRSLESEVGRMAKRLAEATVKHVSLAAEHKRACRERDTLVRMLASEFDWSDTSYLHAMMHVENAIRNLRADARAAQAERDEALANLNEREADVKTLQRELEHAKRLWREEADRVGSVVLLIEGHGCDCECEHHWEEHDKDCERCLACRISMAIQDKKEDER
jgi:hypothetical protein